MDTLLSSRALGYLSILLVMVASFFALIEFFVTALIVLALSVVTVFGLWQLRLALDRKQSPHRT